MANQVYIKQQRDDLRSLLQHQLGPEQAAQYEPYLNSLVREGFLFAEIFTLATWQDLERTGLPELFIAQLGAAFDIPGDPPATPGRAPSLIICCKCALRQIQSIHVRDQSSTAGGTPHGTAAVLQLVMQSERPCSPLVLKPYCEVKV